MTTSNWQNIADNTPIIIAAGQFTEALPQNSEGDLSSPMDLAATAAKVALADTGVADIASHIDSIAVIRLFADSAPAWRCPFGGSNNPPESLARRIGASPANRIYSTAGGSQPLELMAELMGAIHRGEQQLALLAGTEAIASQRHAQRNGIELDWQEDIDVDMDNREYLQRMAGKAELESGMFLPAHFYSLIENYQAWERGQDTSQWQQYMAELLAPMSEVAANNPYAWQQTSYSAEAIASTENGNYPITNPYLKRMIAQDAVNQAAAVLMTSVGKARQMGIPEDKWIFPHGYAQGEERILLERINPGHSLAMQQVLAACLSQAGSTASSMDMVDIYSCFPCAVETARQALGLAVDGPVPLTVTGGLPFFGGPGNNYSMHALAEMTIGLRNGQGFGLISANGGFLSKHAAVVLANQPPQNTESVLAEPVKIAQDSIPAKPVCESPTEAKIISYTVIYQRKGPDIGIVMAETPQGERLLARTVDTEISAAMNQANPIGRHIKVSPAEPGFEFSF